MADSVVVELENDLTAIEHAVEYFVRWCDASCRDKRRLLLNFRVSLTEALSNAMLYGNGDDPEKTVRVELRMVSADLQVEVTDQGTGFDPAGLPDPRMPENLTKPGGRGIFLMRKLVDEVRYNAAGNSVTLILREILGPRSVGRP
jgi:anti-sigma regulatory factor (Ser/Thr protein kinase)